MTPDRLSTPPPDPLQALRRALQPPTEAECLQNRPRLGAYAAAQAAGEDYRSLFPETAAHLDACLECAAAYARLYELELALSRGELPPARETPSPDLGFLRAAPAARPSSAAGEPSLLEQLRHALQRAGDRLTLHLSPGLLLALQPAPSAALRAAPGERYAQPILQWSPTPEQQAEFPFRLAAYQNARQKELCLVEVTLAPPGREWPELSELSVSLTWGGEQRQALTDAWGTAVFEDIPTAWLEAMTIQAGL